MKKILVILILLFSQISFSQSYEKLIDKNDVEGLTKLINSETEIYEEIYFHELDLTVHPMVYAAGKNRLEMVKAFVKNQDKIDDFHTIMSLSFATSISTGNDELISYLYNLEPNVNERCESCHGHTAIMIATVYGNDKWYFKLKPKSELNLLSNDNNNLLHLACETYNVAIFNDIITIKDLNINQKNIHNRTPLQQAAIEGRDTIYFKLKELGATYHEFHDMYFDAIIGGKLNVFNNLPKNDFLWKLHSMPWDEDMIEYYPLESAIINNSTEITEVLFKQMFESINQNKNIRTEILVDILNGRNADGEVISLLWEAIQWENMHLFSLIIAYMVNFNKMEIKYTRYQDDIDTEFNEVAKVEFTKFEYRAAKRKFEKEFVDELYSKYNIKF